MNPLKDVDTSSALSALFFVGVACLPVALLLYAGHASQPKERPVTLREQYPDEHLGI